LAFERSTSSEGVRSELKAELGGFWNKRVGNKGTFFFSPNWIKKSRL